jgi:hypothetical protein
MRDRRPAHSTLRRQPGRGHALTQSFLSQEKNDRPFDGIQLSRARHPSQVDESYPLAQALKCPFVVSAMKAAARFSSLLSILVPVIVCADDTAAVFADPPPLDAATLSEDLKASRPSPTELPEAVKAARVIAQVTVPRGANGAPLIISRIEPPALPKSPPQPRIVPAFTEEQRNAIRADAPRSVQLFSPTITVYPGGISMVTWSTGDTASGYQDYEAWLPHDLTTINIVGDFEVGRTQYTVIGLAQPAAGRALERKPPPPADLHAGYLITKGDPANTAATEPLRALSVIYQKESAQLAATHAAQLTRQQAVAKWERENPQQPRPAEIRFWHITPPPETSRETAPAAPSAK